MMHHDQDADRSRHVAIVQAVRKPLHTASSDFVLNDRESLRGTEDLLDRCVDRIKEVGSKTTDPAVVESCRFDQFVFSMWMPSYSHSIDRRALFMTSS